MIHVGRTTPAPKALIASLILGALTACSAPQTAQVLEVSSGLPRQAEVVSVPFFPQEAFYCGPAAFAMTLAWSGLEATPETVGPQVYTPGREGTLAPDVLAAARRNGRLAIEIRDLDVLLAELAAGHPVLVFQNLALDWWPQWHYAVAVGYDLDRRILILHSGVTERLETPLDAFERTWQRSGYWALLILPPDRLPARAGVARVLVAAAGLEQARQHEAARTAYEAVLRRWPEEPLAWLGKGNALFALDRFAASEDAFRTAVRLQPDAAAAWNNLAYALSRQGRRDEAVDAALKAVALGSGERAYIETLEEVASN